MSSSRLATGDLIRTAIGLLPGSSPDTFLEWLSARVWALRTAREAPCGAVGAFATTADRGTVEIRPGALAPLKAPRRQLDFRASPALELAVADASDERLAALDVDDPLASAFGRALALELNASGRAQIGNFGSWGLGKKPTLETFVRFRSHPAINQRL
jgi:hypothetical protein